MGHLVAINFIGPLPACRHLPPLRHCKSVTLAVARGVNEIAVVAPFFVPSISHSSRWLCVFLLKFSLSTV